MTRAAVFTAGIALLLVAEGRMNGAFLLGLALVVAGLAAEIRATGRAS